MKSGMLTFGDRTVEVTSLKTCAADITLTDERVARIEVATNGTISRAWDKGGQEITPTATGRPIVGRAHAAPNTTPRLEKPEVEPLTGLAWLRDLGNRLWHSVTGKAPEADEEDALLAYQLRPTRSMVTEEDLARLTPLQMMRKQLEFLRSESEGLFATCNWNPDAIKLEADRLSEAIGWMERAEAIRGLPTEARLRATMELWEEQTRAITEAPLGRPMLFSIDWCDKGTWRQMLVEVTRTEAEGNRVRFFNSAENLADLFPSAGFPVFKTGIKEADDNLPVAEKAMGLPRRHKRAVEFRGINDEKLSQLFLPMMMLQTADLTDRRVKVDLMRLIKEGKGLANVGSILRELSGAALDAVIEVGKAENLDLKGVTNAAVSEMARSGVDAARKALPPQLVGMLGGLRGVVSDGVGAVNLGAIFDDYSAGHSVFEMVFSELKGEPDVACEWLGESRLIKKDAPVTKTFAIYNEVVRGETKAMRKLKFQLYEVHLTLERVRPLLADHPSYRGLLLDLCDRAERYAVRHRDEIFDDTEVENLKALRADLKVVRDEVRSVTVAQERSSAQRIERGLNTFEGEVNVPKLERPVGAVDAEVSAGTSIPQLRGDRLVEDWIPTARALFAANRHEELREVCLEMVSRLDLSGVADDQATAHAEAVEELSRYLVAGIYHRMAPYFAESASSWSATPDEVSALVKVWRELDSLARRGELSEHYVGLDVSGVRRDLEADHYFDELRPRSSMLSDLRHLEGRGQGSIKDFVGPMVELRGRDNILGQMDPVRREALAGEIARLETGCEEAVAGQTSQCEQEVERATTQCADRVREVQEEFERLSPREYAEKVRDEALAEARRASGLGWGRRAREEDNREVRRIREEFDRMGPQAYAEAHRDEAVAQAEQGRDRAILAAEKSRDDQIAYLQAQLPRDIEYSRDQAADRAILEDLTIRHLWPPALRVLADHRIHAQIILNQTHLLSDVPNPRDLLKGMGTLASRGRKMLDAGREMLQEVVLDDADPQEAAERMGDLAFTQAVDFDLQPLAEKLRHPRNLAVHWGNDVVDPFGRKSRDMGGEVFDRFAMQRSASQGKAITHREFASRIANQVKVNPSEALMRKKGVNGMDIPTSVEMEFDRTTHYTDDTDHLRVGDRDGVARAMHVLLGDAGARGEWLKAPEVQRELEKTLMRPGVLEKLVRDNPVMAAGGFDSILREAFELATASNDTVTRLFVARLRFRAQTRLGVAVDPQYGRLVNQLRTSERESGLAHQHYLYWRMEQGRATAADLPEIVASYLTMRSNRIEPAYDEFAVEDRITRWVRRQLDAHRGFDWTGELAPALQALYGVDGTSVAWTKGEGEFQYSCEIELDGRPTTLSMDLATGICQRNGASFRPIPHEVVTGSKDYRALFGKERILAEERVIKGKRIYSFRHGDTDYEVQDRGEKGVVVIAYIEVAGERRPAQFVRELLDEKNPGDMPAVCFRHNAWVDCKTGADFYFTTSDQELRFSAQRVRGGLRRMQEHTATGTIPFINVAHGGLPPIIAALEAPNQVRVVDGAIYLDRIGLTLEPAGDGVFRCPTYPGYLLKEGEQPELFEDGHSYGVVLVHERNPERRLFVAHGQGLVSHDGGSAKGNQRKGERGAWFDREPTSLEGGKRLVATLNAQGELESTDPDVNMWLAYLFMAKGRYEEAHNFMEKGLTAGETSPFYDKVCSWIVGWQDETVDALAIQLNLVGVLGAKDWTATSWGGLRSSQLVKKASRYRRLLASPTAQPRVRLKADDLRRVESVLNRGLSGLVLETLNVSVERLASQGFQRNPALGEPDFQADMGEGSASVPQPPMKGTPSTYRGYIDDLSDEHDAIYLRLAQLGAADGELTRWERALDRKKDSPERQSLLDAVSKRRRDETLPELATQRPANLAEIRAESPVKWARRFYSIFLRLKELDDNAELLQWQQFLLGCGETAQDSSARHLLWVAAGKRLAGEALPDKLKDDKYPLAVETAAYEVMKERDFDEARASITELAVLEQECNWGREFTRIYRRIQDLEPGNAELEQWKGLVRVGSGAKLASRSLRRLLYQAVTLRQQGQELEALPPPPARGRLMGMGVPFGAQREHREEVLRVLYFFRRLDAAHSWTPAVVSEQIPVERTLQRGKETLRVVKPLLEGMNRADAEGRIDGLHQFLSRDDSVINDPVTQLLIDSGVALDLVEHVGDLAKGMLAEWEALDTRRKSVSEAVAAGDAAAGAAGAGTWRGRWARAKGYATATARGVGVVRDAYRLGIGPNAIRSAAAAAVSGAAGQDVGLAFGGTVASNYLERHRSDAMPEAHALLTAVAAAAGPADRERLAQEAGIALIDLVWKALHGDLSRMMEEIGMDNDFLGAAVRNYKQLLSLVPQDPKEAQAAFDAWGKEQMVPLLQEAAGSDDLVGAAAPLLEKTIDRAAGPMTTRLSRLRELRHVDQSAAAEPATPQPYSLETGSLYGADDSRFRQLVTGRFSFMQHSVKYPEMWERESQLFGSYDQPHHQRLADELKGGLEEAMRRQAPPITCALDVDGFLGEVKDQRDVLVADRTRLEKRLIGTLRSVGGSEIPLEVALHLWENRQLDQLQTVYGLPQHLLDPRVGLESDLESLELNLIALEELDKWRRKGEKIGRVTGPLERENRIKKLRQMVQQEHFYVRGSDHPHARRILAVERQGKIVVRKAQLEIANQKVNQPNGMTQNPLGIGKSTVIAKLILAAWADGYHLSTLISTEEDRGQALLREDRTTRYPFDMPIYEFRFGEGKTCELEEIQQILMDMRRTAANGGVMVTTKESLLLFRARYLEQLLEHLPRAVERKRRATSAEDKKRADVDLERMHQLIDVWNESLLFLRERQMQLWDEGDRIGDPSDMTNLALSKVEKLEPEMRTVGIEIVRKILGTPSWDRRVQLRQNRQAATLPSVQSDGRTLSEHLREWVADEYAAEFDPARKELVKAYLLDRPEGKRAGVERHPNFKKIVAVKKCLGEGWSALGNEDNVEIGRHGDDVIPYRGAGRPLTSSRIASPWEWVLCVAANYARYGVTGEQIEKHVEILRGLQLKSSRSGSGPHPAVTQFERDFGVRVMDQLDYGRLARTVNENWDNRLQFCLEHVLPNLTYHSRQVRGESAKLTSLSKTSGGFSGSLSLLHALSRRIEKKDARDTTIDCEGLLHMLRWGKTEGGTAYVREPTDDSLLDVLVGCRGTDGLADAGALLKEHSVDEVIDRLSKRDVMEQVKPGAKHIIYVDPETDQWMVRDVRSSQAMRHSERHGLDLKNAFIFYDELSTRAKDFRNPFNCQLTVTVGDKSRETKLLQAENRNRILDGGQGLRFLLPRHLSGTFGEQGPDLIVKVARWLIGTEADYQVAGAIKGQMHELRGYYEDMVFFAMQEIKDPEDRQKLMKLVETTFSKAIGPDWEKLAEMGRVEDLDTAAGCLERVRQQELDRFQRFREEFLRTMEDRLWGISPTDLSGNAEATLRKYCDQQMGALKGHQVLSADLLPAGKMAIPREDDRSQLNVQQIQRSINTELHEQKRSEPPVRPGLTDWGVRSLDQLWGALSGHGFVGVTQATGGLFTSGYVSTNMGVSMSDKWEHLWNSRVDPYVYVVCMRNGRGEWRDVAVSHDDYTRQVVPLLRSGSGTVQACVMRVDYKGGAVVDESPGAALDPAKLRELRAKWTLLSGGVDLVSAQDRRTFKAVIGTGARAEQAYKLHQQIMMANRPASLPRFEGSEVQGAFKSVLSL